MNGKGSELNFMPIIIQLTINKSVKIASINKEDSLNSLSKSKTASNASPLYEEKTLIIFLDLAKKIVHRTY